MYVGSIATPGKLSNQKGNIKMAWKVRETKWSGKSGKKSVVIEKLWKTLESIKTPGKTEAL